MGREGCRGLVDGSFIYYLSLLVGQHIECLRGERADADASRPNKIRARSMVDRVLGGR